MSNLTVSAATAAAPVIPPVSPATLDQRMERILLEPYHYLLEHPGKNIRTSLIEAFNVWMQVPGDKLEIIKDVVDMLHNASLLIDDIEDGSALRRGVPVAHNIYGIPMTINTANFVYFLALQKVLLLKDPRCVEIYTEELCNLHRGQGMDLYWRDFNKCPTEEEYIHMINYKTGGLLRLAVKLMQTFSTSTRDFISLAETLGIHFQIRDDYINLHSSDYMKEKGYCEDITEGKFSFLVIHSIRSSTNSQLLNILKQKTADREVLRYAVECIRRTKSFQYALAYLDRIERKARAQIAELGGSATLDKLLDRLAEVYRKEGGSHRAPAQ